ncbi:hypothetical protein IB286_07775 [Spongiibacter sp. KMU-158]|uniref:Cytochrome c domain-containing protein n=1 Tax=Spongiibacter pelagi TaxID=2760804 RepID=A0A927C3Q2_9GAMM|nr:hypothetical protein [Spongiibacter pelagi]MBD2858910.1 hypothetical protein [Spongiibacter pelagi]
MSQFRLAVLLSMFAALSACGGSSSSSSSPTGNTPNTGNEPSASQNSELLVSRRGGHYWHDFCAGKPDSTVVPADPRELVVPGVDAGRAVLMNAPWQVCQEGNHPGTCGELRRQSERGLALIAAEGRPGAASMFSGDAATSTYAFPASAYAEMWNSIWQLEERPAQYDELVAQRWGMPLSRIRNPYPLAGEDPNETNGGSGQLPMGVTQLREADGRWTGQLNLSCSICHGGAVGSDADGPGLGAQYGTNSLSDITAMYADLVRLAPQQAALAIVAQNKVRGTGNITNFQLFGVLTFGDYESIPSWLTIQAEPSTGTEDPPVWWNLGSRTAKFFDAGMMVDAKRIELSFHFPDFFGDYEAAKQWVLDHQQAGDAWLHSLKSPVWPEAKLGAIDQNLAEAGAILFHEKNLWAQGLQNPVARPEGGNGSCASCHGAYSPRYTNNPKWLASPLLDGVAAYVTPIDIIDTDRARLNGNSQRVADYTRDNWFIYGDGEKNEAGAPICGNWNDEALRGERELGYLAPPLFGVLATAPYFHNGAVPDIDGVLNPEKRPTIWRRQSAAAPAGLEGSVVMGYDYSLQSGYDSEKMGWRYDELPCEAGASLPLLGVTNPLLDCNPLDAEGASLQDGLGLVWGNGGLAWNLINVPILTNEQLEERKIYNTRFYSQSNSGHAFTAVLTEAERRAIKEYLKTL